MRSLALLAVVFHAACFPKLDDPEPDAADTQLLEDAPPVDVTSLADASPADAVAEIVTPPPPSTRVTLQLGATVLRGDRGWVVVGPPAGSSSRLDWGL
jgi:hypothetical protein